MHSLNVRGSSRIKAALVAARANIGAEASSEDTCPLRMPRSLTLVLTSTPNCRNHSRNR